MIRIISIGSNNLTNRILVKMAPDLRNLSEDINIMYNRSDHTWIKEIDPNDLVILIEGCKEGYLPGTVTMHKVCQCEKYESVNTYAIHIEVDEVNNLQVEIHNIAVDVFQIIKKIIENHELSNNYENTH